MSRYLEDWGRTNPAERKAVYPPSDMKSAEERLRRAIIRAKKAWCVHLAYFTKAGLWKKRGVRYSTEWRGDNAPSYLQKAAQV
jgi:hypothetical protein